MKRYPVKVNFSGKTSQLSCLVSAFLSKAGSRKQWLFAQEVAKACCLTLTGAWSVSNSLCSVLPVAEAHLAHCTACAENSVRMCRIPNDIDLDC